GEPIRHAVAHHHHVALGDGVALLRRGRLGEILVDAFRRLLLVWREEIAEPAAAASTEPALARRRPRWSAEIEELRGRGGHDADEQRNRHAKHDQGAGL